MRIQSLLRFTFAASLMLASATSFASDSKWADVNGMSLRYQIEGNGPDVVVLLPSTGKSLEYYDEILPSLAAPNRTILRYDIRGVGLSQKLHGRPITMQDEVNDLKALLDHLHINGPVMFVGTAFGASIQLQFAAQYPARARGVVNISPSAQLVPPPPRPPATTPAEPVANPGAAPNNDRVYPVALRANQQRWERYLGIDAANDAESRRLTEKLIMSTPFADVLPKVKCPTLFVRTELYPRTLESIQELVDVMPKASVISIPSGHEAPLQSPEMITPILLKFFKENGL